MAKRGKRKFSSAIEKLMRLILEEQGYSNTFIDAQIEYWGNSSDDVICIYDANKNVYIPEQLSIF